jgi:hypothetical protein
MDSNPSSPGPGSEDIGLLLGVGARPPPNKVPKMNLEAIFAAVLPEFKIEAQAVGNQYKQGLIDANTFKETVLPLLLTRKDEALYD